MCVCVSLGEQTGCGDVACDGVGARGVGGARRHRVATRAQERGVSRCWPACCRRRRCRWRQLHPRRRSVVPFSPQPKKKGRTRKGKRKKGKHSCCCCVLWSDRRQCNALLSLLCARHTRRLRPPSCRAATSLPCPPRTPSRPMFASHTHVSLSPHQRKRNTHTVTTPPPPPHDDSST